MTKGYNQMQGIDYNDVYSPVVKYSSVRCLLALAAQRELEIDQMDAISAFLQGDIDEEIYIKQPEGFQDGNKVLCLKKSIYGLKQSSRMWTIKLSKALKNVGLAQSK